MIQSFLDTPVTPAVGYRALCCADVITWPRQKVGYRSRDTTGLVKLYKISDESLSARSVNNLRCFFYARVPTRAEKRRPGSQFMVIHAGGRKTASEIQLSERDGRIPERLVSDWNRFQLSDDDSRLQNRLLDPVASFTLLTLTRHLSASTTQLTRKSYGAVTARRARLRRPRRGTDRSSLALDSKAFFNTRRRCSKFYISFRALPINVRREGRATDPAHCVSTRFS